jgi:hypothetical protein
MLPGTVSFPFNFSLLLLLLVADSHSGVADPTELSLQNTVLAPDSEGEDEGLNIHPRETSLIPMPKHSLKYSTYSTRAFYRQPNNHRGCFGAVQVDNDTHRTSIGVI